MEAIHTTVGTTIDGRGVARVTLNRPERHNALSALMISELRQVAEALGQDDAVRVVVLTGAGASFCAGGDLGWMREQMAGLEAARDKTARDKAARALADLLSAWDRLPKPVIGRVQGNAFGGGVGLMAVCDVTVGVDTAQLGLTEVRLGLSPATIGPYVVARMGAARARQVFFSGRIFGAPEAVDLGLLSKAVPPSDLEVAIEAEIAPYLAAAPGAVAEAKQLLRDLASPIDEAMIARSVAALVSRWESAEAAEGISAFFDRRKPDWVAGKD